MEKIFKLNKKSQKAIQIFLIILFIIYACFVFSAFFIVELYLFRIVVIGYTIYLISGILDFIVSLTYIKKNKIEINYDEKTIKVFFKRTIYKENFYIDIQVKFCDILQIELYDNENNLYNLKLITKDFEKDIKLKEILLNWNSLEKEQFAKELLEELQKVSEIIKENKVTS